MVPKATGVSRNYENSWNMLARLAGKFRLRPRLARFRQNLADLGKRRANFGRSRQSSADIFPFLTFDPIGKSWAGIGRIWPIPVNMLPRFGQTCSNLGNILADIGQIRPSPPQFLLRLCNIVRTSENVVQISAKFRRCYQQLACTRPKFCGDRPLSVEVGPILDEIETWPATRARIFQLLV